MAIKNKEVSNGIDEQIINFRRHFHANPELSRQERETANFIEKQLKASGIANRRVAKTGVEGLIETSRPGKTIALRADTDALPIQEENDVPYKSKNPNVMHACGHDAHAAIMLGVAKLLSQEKEALSGRIKFFFQPSEEISGGAEGMIKDGVMKNPKVDMILGAHVSNDLPAGKIGIKFGAMMAGVDRIHIDIEGVMAHGAYPHLGKDALVAAADFVMSAQTIVSRQVTPLEPAVITFGKISGGNNYNVIANKIRIEGTTRTLNEAVRKFIRVELAKRLKSIEAAYGVKCRLEILPTAKPLINDQKITQFCKDRAEEFYGKSNTVIIEKPTMGGEDFSDFLEFAPGAFLNIGTGSKGAFRPHHNAKFDIEESALPKAARFFVYLVKALQNAKL